MTAVATSSAHSRNHFRQHFQPVQNIAYNMADRRMSSAVEGSFMSTALLIQRLPLGTTSEAVRTMLLFANDLQDTEIITNDSEEDQGFATAVARFATVAGASEAQLMLDGKPNTDGQASMIVTITQPYQHNGIRRNTMDPSGAIPVSSASSPRSRMTRYNGGFDGMSKLSPPPTTSPPDTLSDGGHSLNGVFQGKSPRVNGLQDRSRISGKSVIGEEDGDDDTSGLLRDPLSYMRKDIPAQRQIPLAAFNQLSLQTEMPVQSPQSNYMTPRSGMQYSARSPFSPGGQYVTSQNQFPRGHHFPPVNPADQNPPCNTLYVGNLPMDTSEDELKAMFSKQRGYKRLCFRTKQNGPMCFVEFEDISFATKALNELYGAQLHNSVKGGIRLSFSKNPLGVRSGQQGNNTGPTTPINMSHPNMNNATPMSPGSFSANNGPPPGLSAPPGFPAGSGPLPPFYQNNLRSPGHSTPSGNDGYSDYMLGR